MSLTYPVRLRSLEVYIGTAHGAARALQAEEILVLDEFVAAMVEAIQDAWPVDTSTSRDAWTWETRGSDPGWIGFVIENNTPYVQYVHLAGAPPEPPLWETLLPAVVGSYADPMLAALRRQVDATEAALRPPQPAGAVSWLDLIARRLGRARGASFFGIADG